jgi:hypothetical protein
MTTRRSITSEEKLDMLESHLAGTLKRVPPPNDLVRRLRLQARMPARAEIVLRLRDWRTLFLVLGGVMSGMVLIVTVARAFYHLVGRRGAI